MTSTPSLLAELLAHCDAHGIRLLAAGDGGLTIDSPQDALTPDLISRLKAHKGELLTLLRSTSDTCGIDTIDVAAVWLAALDRLKGDPLFLPDVMVALRAADVQRNSEKQSCESTTEPASIHLDSDGWPADSIDPSELTPCPKCGIFDLWESAAGDLFGWTPGQWRCMKCDPPTTARRITALAERIRWRTIQ